MTWANMMFLLQGPRNPKKNAERLWIIKSVITTFRKKQKLISDNPAEDIVLPSVTQETRRPITDEE